MTTAPISGGSLYDPSRMEEVWSWVHELRRCVTARQAALELGMTRGAAVALLATPEKALEAFTTLAEQAATEDGMIALCESMGEVLPPAVLALEAALGATDDEAATLSLIHI